MCANRLQTKTKKKTYVNNCDMLKQCVCGWQYRLNPPRGLITLATELTAATRIMQSSSNEFSTLVSDNANCKQTKANIKCVIIPERTYVAEMAERLDTNSRVKISMFRSHLEASCVSSYTEELWYNETVCGWQHSHPHAYIYIYIYIYGGARGVMVIVDGNGYGNTNSNPGREWLHFT